MDLISFEDFRKSDIKIGKIIQAERIMDSDKLYKLQVDIGKEKIIQIVSGLVEYYTAEKLLGKKIAVLVNLSPAKFRGEESQGMLLCAVDEEEKKCVLLTPEKDIKEGSRVC